ELEEKKLKAARQDALNKEIGLRMVQLTTDLASAVHSMAWLTWSSNREMLTQAKIDSYDAEMHTVLPKISGDVVAIGALDAGLGQLANTLWRDVVRLDVEIGEACIGFANDPTDTKRLLQVLTPRVLNFEQETIQELAKATRGKGESLMDTS